MMEAGVWTSDQRPRDHGVGNTGGARQDSGGRVEGEANEGNQVKCLFFPSEICNCNQYLSLIK